MLRLKRFRYVMIAGCRTPLAIEVDDQPLFRAHPSHKSLDVIVAILNAQADDRDEVIDLPIGVGRQG
jgi:predicted RNase H-like nuclease